MHILVTSFAAVRRGHDDVTRLIVHWHPCNHTLAFRCPLLPLLARRRLGCSLQPPLLLLLLLARRRLCPPAAAALAPAWLGRWPLVSAARRRETPLGRVRSSPGATACSQRSRETGSSRTEHHGGVGGLLLLLKAPPATLAASLHSMSARSAAAGASASATLTLSAHCFTKSASCSLASCRQATHTCVHARALLIRMAARQMQALRAHECSGPPPCALRRTGPPQ